MLPSNSFPSVLSMFGIHLTGHCAAKGRQWSGAVINCNQISSYKDPSPLKRHVLWRPANLINQLLSPQNYQPASFYFTARFIHFLHISSALQRCLRWKRRWMFHHKLLGGAKTCSPCALFSLIGPPLFPLLLPFFIFCLVWLLCMHNSPLQPNQGWSVPGLTHQSRVFYNVKAMVSAPLAFLPGDIFCLRSIN